MRLGAVKCGDDDVHVRDDPRIITHAQGNPSAPGSAAIMMDPSEDETRLAEQLVDETLQKLGIREAALREIIRESLLDELLCTPDGRRRLREAMPDPQVGRSGDIERSDLSTVPQRKRERLR